MAEELGETADFAKYDQGIVVPSDSLSLRKYSWDSSDEP
jgi:hypothetical protein